MQNDTKKSTFSGVLTKEQVNLQKIDNFIQVSHRLFEKKLSAIENQIKKADSEEEIRLLKQQAVQLHREYTESIAFIQNYIDELENAL